MWTLISERQLHFSQMENIYMKLNAYKPTGVLYLKRKDRDRENKQLKNL